MRPPEARRASLRVRGGAAGDPPAMTPLARREAQVTWSGTLGGGAGELRVGGGAAQALPMDWASRSEQADGTTSPEELLAAAHAGCYAMQLALELARNGTPAGRLEVGGTCDLEEDGENFRISRLTLDVQATVDGLDEGTFQEIVARADAACPIAAVVREGTATELHARLLGA
jgi:osmotically inducible protein OsmC